MQTAPPKRLLNYLTYRLLHTVNRLARPLTMGVRACVIDAADQVLLVRHSYVPGWHFPGGGVEPGESARAALTHELIEEANIELTGEPSPLGLYFNNYASERDHVFVYVVRQYRQTAPRVADAEILEARFFPWNGLPEGATEATRARVAEIFSGAPLRETW